MGAGFAGRRNRTGKPPEVIKSPNRKNDPCGDNRTRRRVKGGQAGGVLGSNGLEILHRVGSLDFASGPGKSH